MLKASYLIPDLPPPALATAVFLDKRRIGRSNYYMNQRLVALFVDGAI